MHVCQLLEGYNIDNWLETLCAAGIGLGANDA